LLKPIAAWHFRKPRQYNYEGIELTVLPSVFHPGIYLSTNILIAFIKKLELPGKQFLELGAGSGLVSFVAAQKGAFVTATDINPKAIEGIKMNAEKNVLNVQAIVSNLFENIDGASFDIIIINPPYYPKDPSSGTEMAFYCGQDFGYFQRLFSQVNEEIDLSKTAIFMILSEDCELNKIAQIAQEHGIDLNLVHEEKKLQERNYIFKFVEHE